MEKEKYILDGLHTLQEMQGDTIVSLQDLARFCTRYNVTRKDVEKYLAVQVSLGKCTLQYVGANCYIIFS